MQKVYEIIVKGKGGHASMPQKANNPILIASGLILQLCRMSLEISEKMESAGIKVIAWEAGEKGNIIPEQAKVKIIIYAQDEKLLSKIYKRIVVFGDEFIHVNHADIIIDEMKE